MFYHFIVCLLLWTTACRGQDSPCSSNNVESCVDCFSRSPDCVWCPEAKWTTSRCMPRADTQGTKCPTLQDFTSSHQATKDDPFSSVVDRVVQIRPQSVTLNARPKEKYSVDVKFKFAENYPVDLYLLMDFSNSMCGLKQLVVKEALRIADTMRNITANFKLGFGGFVDKQTAPFIDLNPQALEWPCPTAAQTDPKYQHCGCQKAFGFKNFVSLTTDVQTFQNVVRKQNISSNVDGPEGGLDGLVQVMMCEDIVGWRGQSRRIVVYASDAGVHMAGDGRVAGLTKPFQPNCFLERIDNVYSLPLKTVLEYDYPSFSQVQDIANSKKINFIFAVAKEMKPYYEEVARFFDDAQVGTLDTSNETDLVELIASNYKKISQSISMKLENPSKYVDYKIFSKCVGEQEYSGKPRCDIAVGQEVSFRIELTVNQCPEKPSDFSQSLLFGFSNLQDKLELDLKMQCSCDCETPGHSTFEKNSIACSVQGDLVCGSCKCGAGFGGSFCNCSLSQTGASAQAATERQCLHNATNTICSARGKCECGSCKCDVGYSGRYCECDDTSCPKTQGRLCNDHGHCACGVCQCSSGWTNARCSCENSTTNCVTGATMCNDHGRCECNRCKCSGAYKGPRCDDCPTCKGACAAQKQCVLCRAFKTYDDEYTEQFCKDNCQHVSVVSELSTSRNDPRQCQDRDSNGCDIFYQYWYQGSKLFVEARSTRDCPKEVNLFMVIGVIVGAIVLIGIIALLIYFCIKRYRDKQELKKFNKEVGRGRVQESGLYERPTQTFKNQTFQGNGDR